MSAAYIQRLRAVQMEFSSVREAISFVQRNWQKYDIYADLTRLKPVHFDEAGSHVEMTYFVRLYAEFEGILKDHLATNHSTLRVQDKPKVDKLISLVIRAEGIALDPNLRRKMDGVRDYRNSIAHHAYASAPSLTFVGAQSSLNTFLAKLPDPHT
jgi:hypothetical protein